MKSIVATMVPLVIAGPAHAAVDQFLCIEGVTGTCTIVASNPGGTLLRVNGWVQVGAISFGGSNVAPASDPYGPGTASAGAVEVIKPIDDLSPTLFLSALQGTAVDLQIAYRRAGGVISTIKPYILAEYTDITLTVSQYQQTGDDPPAERITFERPAGYTFQYWKQKSDGTLINPPLVATWPVTP